MAIGVEDRPVLLLSIIEAARFGPCIRITQQDADNFSVDVHPDDVDALCALLKRMADKAKPDRDRISEF